MQQDMYKHVPSLVKASTYTGAACHLVLCAADAGTGKTAAAAAGADAITAATAGAPVLGVIALGGKALSFELQRCANDENSGTATSNKVFMQLTKPKTLPLSSASKSTDSEGAAFVSDSVADSSTGSSHAASDALLPRFTALQQVPQRPTLVVGFLQQSSRTGSSGSKQQQQHWHGAASVYVWDVAASTTRLLTVLQLPTGLTSVCLLAPRQVLKGVVKLGLPLDEFYDDEQHRG
eukprot:3782-Heterococcus_DN1.PRE.3